MQLLSHEIYVILLNNYYNKGNKLLCKINIYSSWKLVNLYYSLNLFLVLPPSIIIIILIINIFYTKSRY